MRLDREKVVRALGRRRLTAGQLASILHCRQAPVYRALRLLVVQGAVEKVGALKRPRVARGDRREAKRGPAEALFTVAVARAP